ncbi:MAG: tetratricopeptide repeat protein, partial [Prosthecobacter sp.]|nr:tetratricopeptide repeat protein [Prosthecobacter sp.]
MFAACNSAAHRDACIRALEGAVGGRQITAPVTTDTEDAFVAAQQAVGTAVPAALHLIRLELAVPADESRLTCIRQLNLRRSDWRQFACPVVLWVPEYLLGILMRRAPDFSDWRSGSLVFVAEAGLNHERGLAVDSKQNINALEDSAWDWELALPAERKARIAELRVRLGLDETLSQPPVIRSDIEASWIEELIYLLTLSDNPEGADWLLPILTNHWENQPHNRISLYLNLTDIWQRIGNTAQAWASAQQALEMAQIHAEKDLENLLTQRDLSNCSNWLGNVAVAQGNLDQAARLFGEQNKLAKKLAQRDPANTEWQRDLSISYEKLGNVAVAQGNLDQAARLYGDALKLAEKLAQRDPANTEWQRDLSVSYNKLGDVAVAQGNLDQAARLFGDGLKLREKLAQSDPANTQWQRDLSISYEKLGDVAVAQKNLDQAARLFGDGLKLREKLAQRDPANTQWQRDLSISYEKLGNVAVAQGNLDQAARLFGDGLKLSEKLAQRDPANTQWQRDLSVSYNKLGNVAVAQGNLDQAARLFGDGLKL